MLGLAGVCSQRRIVPQVPTSICPPHQVRLGDYSRGLCAPTRSPFFFFFTHVCVRRATSPVVWRHDDCQPHRSGHCGSSGACARTHTSESRIQDSSWLPPHHLPNNAEWIFLVRCPSQVVDSQTDSPYSPSPSPWDIYGEDLGAGGAGHERGKREEITALFAPDVHFDHPSIDHHEDGGV